MTAEKSAIPSPVELSGGNVTITRGIPIEKLPDPAFIESAAVFAITDKLNEVIDRINAMNEVRRVL